MSQQPVSVSPLWILAGPTASGKSALAIALAQQWNAEIVSADSQAVYRYFDIGTAKPTPEQLAVAPHHLVSVVEPTETFSAASFQKLADAAIAGISQRGRKVIIVGGTGLYLRALLHGLVEAPSADAQLRAQLTEEAERLGNQALHDRLAKVDPSSAAKLNVADRVRIIRALEIEALTGIPASRRRAEHGFGRERYPFKLTVLNPPREAMYEAINQRAKAMFKAGLVEETRALVARGFRDTAPMRSVGYVQALGVIDGAMTEAEAIADTAQKTRHYAKRQLTWFRKEQNAEFIEPPFTLERLTTS